MLGSENTTERTPFPMESTRVESFVNGVWDDTIVSTLEEYIRIPNKSPLFDPEWKEKGHMDKAVALIADWCGNQGISDLKLEVVQLEGRTPVIYMELDGDNDDTILLYGHLDKQPEMVGWKDGLGPWEPVIQDDKLYGRGGADDGYAAFASLTAIRAVREAKEKHARCVVLIEACEESGSYDLPFYIDHLADRIGTPSLVICLDSGCGNYDQLWCTTSLRGIAVGDLTVEILNEGVHSGDASGIVPSSFRILRTLLSRLEDQETGRILPAGIHADIPQQRMDQAKAVAAVLGSETHDKFPFVDGAGPVSTDPTELILNRTWRPALAITGAEGLPALKDSGNVLRPKTAVKVSLRVPPTGDVEAANGILKELFESNPPYGAKVTYRAEKGGTGWNAPALAPWLEKAAADASRTYFGKDAVYMGEGGSIPFMGMLGEKFPEAQFMITGVLGPHSNAHGPNEFLHIPFARRLTACVANIVRDHFHRQR